MDENGSVGTVDGRGGKAGSRSLLVAVLVLVLALAASCGGASGEGGGQQPAGGGGDAPAEERAAVNVESLGEANAPVVLTEYGDYG